MEGGGEGRGEESGIVVGKWWSRTVTVYARPNRALHSIAWHGMAVQCSAVQRITVQKVLYVRRSIGEGPA